MNTRLAGALYFKNFIGRNWTVGVLLLALEVRS
jgi:hypothetical protein